jgi:hypothetical protein
MEVWSYMENITRAHDCWTYVRPVQRTKDGVTPAKKEVDLGKVRINSR